MIIIEEIKKQAEENLINSVRSGSTFMPVAFIDSKKRQRTLCIPLNFKDDDKKDFFEKIGIQMAIEGSSEVFLVMDCCSRTVSTPEEVRYINDNYDTERPGLYPPSMRTEMLVFNLIDFKNKDSLSSISYRINNKNVEFLERVDNVDACEGFVRNCIRTGFLVGMYAVLMPIIKDEKKVSDFIKLEYKNIEQ